jgi:hypothetical protein
MAKEKVLIAVKTYPVISESYTELACTAGFREDGSWIRLYPIPFRLLDQDKRYDKYQWVEVDIARSSKDPRPESHKVVNVDNMALLNKIDTGKSRDWAERRRLILSRNKIYKNKKEIIAKAHANELSLVIFKPAKILGFVIEDAEPDWPQDKLQSIQDKLKQGNFFEEQNLADFQPVRKLPHKFSYRFLDDEGIESKLMIEDWEIGALYWNCLRDHGAQDAPKKVREKYLDDFAKTKDLYLFLGTTREHHAKKAPNPFVIVGTFHPPHETQASFI